MMYLMDLINIMLHSIFRNASLFWGFGVLGNASVLKDVFFAWWILFDLKQTRQAQANTLIRCSFDFIEIDDFRIHWALLEISKLSFGKYLLISLQNRNPRWVGVRWWLYMGEPLLIKSFPTTESGNGHKLWK